MTCHAVVDAETRAALRQLIDRHGEARAQVICGGIAAATLARAVAGLPTYSRTHAAVRDGLRAARERGLI